MNAPRVARVFAHLADGRLHGADALAGATGIDLSTVESAIGELETLGVSIERCDRDGYRISQTIDWLDRSKVSQILGRDVASDISSINLLTTASSSNDVLLTQPPPAVNKMAVCLVEYQFGGRGRRGRSWTAPPGGSLCLSAAWTFAQRPSNLSALSLATAVAVMRAIAAVSDLAVAVKWPNDIVVDDRKLGGILVELRDDSAGVHVVTGIGINIQIPDAQLAAMCDWPRGAIDLAQAAGSSRPSRNVLAAALISELLDLFKTFSAHGFSPYIDEWTAAHVLSNAPVVLRDGSAEQQGIVRGVAADGALLFETGGQLKRVLVGELSLRAAQ
jgi:BirA family biotin operon repressor/biotin-[acetyl-CoA-carboxylase] ligase